MRIFAAAVAVLLSTSAAPGWAAPADPVPVKNQPGVEETAPTAYGDRFGWLRNSVRRPDHTDFYVQRGTGPRIKVNAPRTLALGGGITGHSVFYAQHRVIQRPGPDRLTDRPQIVRLDLETGKRSVLPARVNRFRVTYGGDPQQGAVHGDVSVSGPWLLFSGGMASRTDNDALSYDTVMLYNRVTHRLRTVTAVWNDIHEVHAGQVNGRYATYRYYSYADEPEGQIGLYDIETKQRVDIVPTPATASPWEPGVSSDGTVYYFQNATSCPDVYCDDQLVRHPIDGPPEVLATLPDAEEMTTPVDTFVEDLPDGGSAIYFTWNGDSYRVVDAR